MEVPHFLVRETKCLVSSFWFHQCGFYFLLGVNVVNRSMRGCQIGLVNYAHRIDGGLQVGLVNIAPRNGWLPILPIVNGHF